MKYIKYSVMLIILLVFLSCSDVEYGCDGESLIKTANEYLNAEMTKDWNITYKLRDKKFQKTVPFKIYSDQMNKDGLGWEMINFKLGKYNNSFNQAEMQVEIKEKLPEKLITNKQSIISFRGIIKFSCKDRKWFIVELPSRSHFSLNSAIVFPE